jgi:hypothetical protein
MLLCMRETDEDSRCRVSESKRTSRRSNRSNSGNVLRSHAMPPKPAAHVHSPEKRSQMPMFEHSAYAWAVSAAVGTSNHARSLGQVPTSTQERNAAKKKSGLKWRCETAEQTPLSARAHVRAACKTACPHLE